MSGYVYKGKKTGELDPWAEEEVPVREACGTTAGYQQHMARKEATCEPCRAAKREYAKRRYHARPIPKAGCGTSAGRFRHRREGTPICDECRVAAAAYDRELRARRKKVAA